MLHVCLQPMLWIKASVCESDHIAVLEAVDILTDYQFLTATNISIDVVGIVENCGAASTP